MSSAPGTPTSRERQLQQQAADLAGKNERLVEALSAARSQLVELRNQLEQMSKPPGSYAVFVGAHEDRTADVMSAERKLRVGVGPSVAVADLATGQEGQLSEAMPVVEAGGSEPAGKLGPLLGMLGTARA